MLKFDMRKLFYVFIFSLFLIIITTMPSAAKSNAEAGKTVKTLKIPVFMYHTSSENNPGKYAELYVKPSEFENQLKYLSDNNYTFCTFDDWYDLYNIKKPVFITFDDGYEENYTEIFPVLQKYNAKITIFLIADFIDNRYRLTSDLIREMSDSGLVKFESHTMTHSNLAGICSDEAKITGELRNSKRKIEKITGIPVLAIAYPGGKYNNKVIQKAKKYYKFGLIDNSGMHNSNINDFAIRRLAVSRYTSIKTFIKLLGE